MRFLVSGGCKNGKSTLALALALAQGNEHAYIATMQPTDDEDRSRILRHQSERRGLGFKTVEQGKQIEKIIDSLPHDTSLVIDSTTALLANEMFSPGGQMDAMAMEKVSDGLHQLLGVFHNVVLVSDAIYSDARQFDAATESYRRSLALIDRALALHMDGVVELLMGTCILHKGNASIQAMIRQAVGGFYA